jgi:Uma2 family endonuclease
MQRANVRFNYRDYALLPADKRYEVLDGDLCMVPAPGIKHQRVSRKMVIALSRHLKAENKGELFYAPCDVILSDEDIVQPDILFVRKERSFIIRELNLKGPPDLAIEILSPGTRDKDLEVKRKIYARFGVKEYWILDPDAETVEVLVWSELGYASAGIYSKSDRLSSPLLPHMELLLAEIFEEELS